MTRHSVALTLRLDPATLAALEQLTTAENRRLANRSQGRPHYAVTRSDILRHTIQTGLDTLNQTEPINL